MIAAHAHSISRRERRYASLPGWVFWVNALSIAVGWTLLGFTLSTRDFGVIFLWIADLLAFSLHFLLVFLPTISRALFVDRVAPLERVIAVAMAFAGPTGTFLGVYFWS